jgi:o-succinylbenzoate---CoA ligase
VWVVTKIVAVEFFEQQIKAWLAVDRSDLLPILAQKQQEWISRSQVTIATTDPDEFITDFLAGIVTGTPIFLASPDWGATERQKLQEITGAVDRQRHQGQIMIPTGGTSGQLKFAIHTPATLTAAVRGFQQFYQVTAINSCGVLPLHHVSGLMPLWRSLMTGGQLWLPIKQQMLEQSPPPNSFISLVPTQLQRILATHPQWLRQFKAVLIGGAPVWPRLLELARQAQIPLSLSYGMTETAALVAALQPQDFLAGVNASGQALPHVQLQIQASGHIMVRSESVMLGYYPQVSTAGEWLTDDLGAIDRQGCLQIWGRASHKIITGGEKVFPAEVEAVIRSTGLVTDVYVLGVPDSEWGERVVAVYVGVAEISQMQAAIQGQLSNFKQPKTWWAVSEIPRNSQAKIDRSQILELLSGAL